MNEFTIDRDWYYNGHRELSEGVYGCAQFVRYLYLDRNVVGRIVQAQCFELYAAVLPSRKEFWLLSSHETFDGAMAAAKRAWMKDQCCSDATLPATASSWPTGCGA